MQVLSLNIGKESSQTLSTLVNPFNKNSISRINIEIYPEKSPLFREGKIIEATLWFSNNKTSGFHRIFADTLEETVTLIKATLDELEK